ncbi:MAG: O-antigen ligase family protein [Actinobacteria bacterium]|nr:O-antigen ligase family protein [Actinomycetota bacterium]
MAKKIIKRPTKAAKQSARSEQFDQWVFYGFLAIVITLPLAISRITFDQFDIAKIFSLRLLTLLTLAFWIGKMLTSRKPEVRWSRLDFVVIGFLVLVLISTITSIHFPTALHGKFKRYEGLLTFINYGIIYFLALQTFTSFKRLSALGTTITLVGGLVSLYGIMQYAGLDPLGWATLPFEERRSFSTFGNPDLLAGFLVLLIPITVAEFFRTKGIKDGNLRLSYNVLLFLCYALAFMVLLFTFTRGAWIGAAVAFLAFIIIGARAIIAHRIKTLLVFGGLIVIFVAVAIYSASATHGVMNLIERLKSATQITEGSAGSRIEIWKAGLKMIEERPLFGLGPDTFRLGSERYETFRYVKMGQGHTVADNAHNWIIQLAAGIGIPATLLLIILFAAVVVIAVRYAWKLQGDERIVHAGLISAIIGYFIHLLFGVSISGSTAVFWVIIGALAATTAAVRTARVVPNEASAIYLKVAIALLVAVSIISSYYAMAMYIGDYYYARAIRLANDSDFEAAFTSYERAIGLYKNGRYFDGYGLFLEQLGVAQNSPDMIEKAISIHEKSKMWEPDEADHYVFLASAQTKLATDTRDPVLNDAVQELNEALEKRPNGLSARILLANILLFQEKYKEAIEKLEFVLAVHPENETGIQLLAQCYEGLGDKDKAKESYERLLSFKPDSEAAKDGLERLSK